MHDDQGQRLQLHSFQFNVAVSSVSIQIRFPCKLSLSVRVGKDEVISDEQVKLSSGRAVFEGEMTIKCSLGYSPLLKKYQEKKSIVSVYIISTTGRNIAGVCSFDAAAIANSESLEESFEGAPLERCPDRAAQMNYRIRGTFLQEMSGHPSQGNSFTGGFPEDMKAESKLLTSRENKLQTRSNIAPRATEMVRAQRRYELPRPIQRTEREGSSNSQQLIEQNQSSRQREMNRSRFSAARLQLASNKRREESDMSLQISTLKAELTENERKLTRLQLEKENYVREITQLKGLVESARVDRMSKNSREVQLQADNERLKRKIDSLEGSLETARRSRIDLEKSLNDRTVSSRNEKSLQDELQSKNARMEELESQVKAAKRTKDEVDKSLKEKVRELKDYGEKIDDLQNSLSTLQKRFDMKDAFYKEEVKKYNDKFMEAEREKLKLSTQLNSLKEGGEDGNRRLQQLLKDKEKGWIDEKTKLTKRSQQLKKDLDRVEAERQQDKIELQQQVATVEKLNKSIAVYEYDKISLMEQVERLKNQLISEGLYKGRYDECLKEKNLLSQQKISLEKELEEQRKEKTVSLGTLTRQHSDANTQARSLGQQLADCQKKIKEKDLKINELELQCESQRKKCQNLRKADEKKALEIEQRKATEKSQQASIKELNEAVTELQSLLSQNRERADNDVESLRRTLKKTAEENEQNKFKLTSANDTVAQLREQLQDTRDREAAQTDKNVKLEDKLKKLKTDLQARDANARQLADDISGLRKQVDDTKIQLNQMRILKEEVEQRLSRTYDELTELRDTLDNSQNTSTEQLLRLQKQAKEKDAELNDMYETQTRLEIQVSQIEAQLTTAKEELRTRTAQLTKERSSSELIRRQLSQLREDYAEIEELLKARGDELVELRRESGQTSSDKSRVDEQLAAARSELQRWKKNNQQSMRTLLEEVSKQTFSVDRLLQGMIDYDTSSVQVEILKAVRVLTEQHTTAVGSLNEQIELISRELSIEKARASQRETQLETTIAIKQEEYEYVKKAMQLEKQNLEEFLDSQTHRLEQSEADGQLFSAERDRFQSMYKRTVLEKEEVSAKLDTTTRTLQAKEVELSSVTAELAMEKRIREDTKNRLEGECTEAEKKLQSTQKELRNHISRLEEQIKMHMIKNEEVSLQLKSARTELDSRAATIRALEEKITVLDNELHEKGLDVNSGYKRQKDLSDRVRQLEDILLSEEQQIAKKNVTIGELQDKIRELEDARKAVEREKGALARRFQQSQEDVEGKDLTIANQSQQIDQLREENESLASRLAQLESSKMLVSEESTTKTRQIQEQNKQMDQLKERFVKLEREITQKSDEILLLKDANDREQKRLNAQIEDLKINLQLGENTLKKEQQANEKRYREMEQIILEQQKVREQLESEVSQLNEDLYIHSSDVNTLRLKEQEDNDLIKQLQKELASVKQNLNEVSGQLEQKEYFINVDLAGRERDYYDLQKKLQQKINQLNRQLSESKQELLGKQDYIQEREQQRQTEIKQLKQAMRAQADEKRQTEQSLSLQLEQAEFKRQTTEIELQGVRNSLKRVEQSLNARISELEAQIDQLESETSNKEQNLNELAQARREQIKKLNIQITQLEIDKEQAQSALTKEKQMNQLAAKQAEQKQRQHQSELARLQSSLEESLRETSQNADGLLKAERQAAERALNEAQREYEQAELKLRNDIAELQIQLHLKTEQKSLLQTQLISTEEKLSVTLDQLRTAEAAQSSLGKQLAALSLQLQNTQKSNEAAASSQTKQYAALQKVLEQTEKKLEQTAAQFKSLNERKVCYNPAHCYLPEILNSVKIYQSQKNDLMVKVEQLETALRRESERLRLLTSQSNGMTEEKTRILNRLRELSVTVLKSKTKALSKTRNQSESKIVADEYKIFQDNIRELLEYSTNLFQMDVADEPSPKNQASVKAFRSVDRVDRVSLKEQPPKLDEVRQPIKRSRG